MDLFWSIKNSNFNKELIEEKSRKILHAFALKYNNLGYIQGLNYLSLTIGKFLNQEDSFLTLIYIYENVY